MIRINLTHVGQDGTFQGYASVFNKLDSYKDSVLPGAFAEAIERRGISGIKMTLQHDVEELVGVWHEIREDKHGLFVRGQLDMNTECGREVHSLMKSGALNGLSIGFDDSKTVSEKRDGVRYVKKIDLWEIAIVTFPALEEAKVDSRMLYDNEVEIADTRRTNDGYLAVVAKVARTGIQLYRGKEVGRPDKDVVRVYRPASEVFSDESLRSYAHRPTTNDHPPVMVDASNWKKYATGQTGGKVLRDKEYVEVPFVLMDSSAIDDVVRGKRQLSLGYTTVLDWTPGKTDDGQDYDAVQTNIRANHLAVVRNARGGPNLNIRLAGDHAMSGDEVRALADALNEKYGARKMMKTIVVDEISVEVSDIAAGVVERAIRNHEKQIASLRSALEKEEEEKKKAKDALDKATADNATVLAAKDTEITTLKKQVTDSTVTPEKLDGLVKDRAEVVDKATKVLGDKLVVTGKTNDEMRRQVVDHVMGDSAKGWNADQVSASFNTIVASAPARVADNIGGNQRIVAALQTRTVTDAASEAAKSYTEREKKISDAWRTPSAA